jgi:hypothetical protein
VTVQFRGRELSHAHLGRDLLVRFSEQVGEHANIERQPLLEGKQMSLVMTSTHKPKMQRKEEEQNGAEATPEGESPQVAPAEVPAAAAPAAAKPEPAATAKSEPAATAKSEPAATAKSAGA